jgi:hypothetical protein
MKIDSESTLLTKREREFLRLIALRLREHAEGRWPVVPTERAENSREGDGKSASVKD